MTTEAPFRVVLRGYEPTQVDATVADLTERVRAAEEAAHQLHARLEQAQAEHAAARDTARELEALPVEPPSFAHLGERVGQILALAEEEAAHLHEKAVAEAEARYKGIEKQAVAARDEADVYADRARRDADTEAARILADARKAADEERDDAEREASARRQEAEAVYEQQKANAARAAAEFETTLAERRERTAAEFQEQQASTAAQLETMQLEVEQTRDRLVREQSDADKEARRVVTAAQEQAESIVREARSTAERVRIDSERELAAATQRRDSINAQLVNVRQMLATLSGSAAPVEVEQIS
jgi:cell division septum initiation protein DivIVA